MTRFHLLLSVFLLLAACNGLLTSRDGPAKPVIQPATSHLPEALETESNPVDGSPTQTLPNDLASSTHAPIFDVRGMTIAAQKYWYDSILLIDLESKELHEVPFPAQQQVSFLGWSPDGCEANIGPFRSDQGSIIRFDLEGNVKGKLLSFNWEIPGGFVENLFLSPNREWIAFTVVDSSRINSELGEQPSGGSNLYLAKIAQPDKIQRITGNGGVQAVSWSPDSSKIAVTDYDSAGIIQANVVAPDSLEVRQVTQETNPNAKIANLAWSGDSTRISLQFEETQPGTGDEIHKFAKVAIIYLQESPIRILDFEELINQEISYLGWLWWQGTDTIGTLMELAASSPRRVGLYWFDADSGELLQRALETEPPSSIYASPKSIGEFTGFFTLDEFIVIDPSSTELLFRMPHKIDIIQDWFPNQMFRDLTRNCQQ